MGVWIETRWKRILFRWYYVTPFVGVWIETLYKVGVPLWGSSHTLRGCVDWNNETSQLAVYQMKVTPFVGVWIETLTSFRFFAPKSSHTLRGCVDWNCLRRKSVRNWAGHTLRGCVDWNFVEIRCRHCHIIVTPFVGVWIETEQELGTDLQTSVTPFVSVWIETYQNHSK